MLTIPVPSAPGRVFYALAAAVVCGLVTLSASGQCADWQDRSGDGGTFPTAHPLPTMCFDSARSVTVAILGFRPESDEVTDLYEFNGTAWVRRLSGAMDGPRFNYGVAYDAAHAKTLIFGGTKGIGASSRATNSLFLWDGATMQPVTPSGLWPPANGKACAAFDPARGRVIVIMDDEDVSGMWQTWEWTGAAGGWDRGPSFGLIGQSATQMVFDTQRNRAFVYTSGATDEFQQVWEYTPGATAAQGVWQRVTISGEAFVAYTGAGLVYDAYRGRILRFGGKAMGSLFGYNDGTWWWNTSTSRWDFQLQYAHNPGPRAGVGIAFDSTRDRVVIVGGIQYYLDGQGTGRTRYYNDTWELYDRSPGFVTQPGSLTVDGGATAIFAVATAGDQATIQWIHDDAPVAGATGAILSVPNSSAASEGWYWVHADNGCGNRDSLRAHLSVRPPVNNSLLAPTTIFSETIAGTTLGATVDGTATCGNANASPDVWYTYTVPYTGTLTIDTCGSDFDTVLSLSTCCPGPGTPVACNDDAPTQAGCGLRDSWLSFAVTQGQRFLVRIAGYNGAVGHYTLNTRVVPFNNSCTAPTTVFSGTYVGTTIGATVDGGAACGTSNATPDIWFRFVSDCSGTLLLDTAGSTFDTVLSVQVGCGAGATAVTCNDDCGASTQSCVGVTVSPNTDYRIRVSGFNGATGNVVLHVTPPPPANDDCAGAAPIGVGVTAFGTRCAATSGLALPPWCESAAGAVPFYDRWYRYTAAADGILEIRLCNLGMNTALAAYAGACPASAYEAFVCAAREDSCGDTPLAAFPTRVGEQYLIRIGGYYGLNPGLAGSGMLDLTLTPFDPGACCLAAAGGGCQVVQGSACVGVFKGEGTVCSPSPCPPLVGACCTGARLNVCSSQDAAQCAAAGGTFHGAGSVCLQSEQNPVTCCRANINGVDGVTVQDIFDFLSAFFGSDLRADFDNSGDISVQDIFDFLSAFFAGCSG